MYKTKQVGFQTTASGNLVDKVEVIGDTIKVTFEDGTTSTQPIGLPVNVIDVFDVPLFRAQEAA